MTELHRKYRPACFADVIGQSATIKSLQSVIKRKGSQVFLFCGSAGVGKTTLARIAARELGCLNSDILEKSGSEETGVDDMRKILEILQYRPFGKSKMRGVIIDECHNLSSKAWDSLLKVTEEPPDHVIWLFCTTNPAKVPHTLKTRCITYTLKPLTEEEIRKAIDRVIKVEHLKPASGVVDLIVHEARGSARQALQFLEQCSDVANRKEAADLIKAVLDSDPVRELCQFLLKGGSWVKAMLIVEKLKKEHPEGVRINVVNYMAAVLKNSKSDQDACRVLTILDAFSTPYRDYENLAPLLVSMGKSLFSE